MIELDGFGVEFSAFSLGPLSLTIRSGERVALVGPNGAGKSTTLKGICGLLPGGYLGHASVDGREVVDVGPDVRRTVGMLPERMLGFGWMRVAEHLAFLSSFFPAWDEARVEELLRRLDLPADAKLANLSKGMQVKLSFVAAEGSRPPILLLDEPTSGIDPIMRKEIVDLLREAFREDSGRAVVFSTHILEDVEAVAERVLLLRAGRLIADTSVAALRADSEHGSVSEAIYSRLAAHE